MSKLYHVTVTANNGTHQEDIIAASMDVAVKRALAKSYRTSKSLSIEANLSNHGEYDRINWSLLDREGKMLYSLKRRDGTYLRPPAHICRATAQSSAASLARQFIDMCDEVGIVVATSRGVILHEVAREGVPVSPEVRAAIDKRLRYLLMLV
jgi:hypothetical protein